MLDHLLAVMRPSPFSNILVGIVFAVCWVGYEPAMRLFEQRRGSINQDLDLVRAIWMRRMLEREIRIMDTNLIGHVLNSASFFASTSLLIIAAAAGLLFGGSDTMASLRQVTILEPAPDWLLELKIALVVVVLASGLLDLIWAIRQLNYCVALVGAAPERDAGADLESYTSAAAGVMNPAMASFNRGVRAYYFALAAAAWLISGWAMLLGAAAALALLMYRQGFSAAAGAAARARLILERDRTVPSGVVRSTSQHSALAGRPREGDM